MLKFNKKFVDIGKEKIAYLEEGSGKEVLLLIHGNMSSSVHYLPMIERLKNQYKIVAPDLRGFGDSTYNNGFNSIHELADDMILFLEKLGIKKVYVAGWSTGGAVAQVMAAKAPEVIKKVVLIESCSPKGYPIFKKDEKNQAILGKVYENKQEMAKDPVQIAPAIATIENKNFDFMDYLWNAVIYTAGNKPTPEDNKVYLEETFKERCLIDTDWALATFNITNEPGFQVNGDGLVNKIVAPILIIWGEKDITVNKYMFDETARIFSKATKIVNPDSGHSPLIDIPDKLSKDVAAFCK